MTRVEHITKSIKPANGSNKTRKGFDLPSTSTPLDLLVLPPAKAQAKFGLSNFMNEPAITPELVQKHNLTPEEYDRVKAILGRQPTYTELGIFSVMWSEHCSYKNSRPLLKTFPTKSPKILVGAGEENAGIIDIGDCLAIAFKFESHHHPSGVEPFQGAATGVGGIIRDIFTMGARPICSLNSLRFGPITDDGPPHPSPLPPGGGEAEATANRTPAASIAAGGAAGRLPRPGGRGRL